MLFGEGHGGPDLLLTERAHHMRSHPGQVSFPGGSIDPGETPGEAALREARGGDRARPVRRQVFAELPELWLPPSNFAVTPVLGWWHEPSDGRGWSTPTRCTRSTASPIASWSTRRTASPYGTPRGWVGPGFLIGDDNDVILWGFTAGHHRPALRATSAGPRRGRRRAGA